MDMEEYLKRLRRDVKAICDEYGIPFNKEADK